VAAEQRTTQLVANVHAFPGHIACDAASRSELVVPVLRDSRTVAVIDLDSPELDRFDREDAAGIEALAELIAGMI
jgi:L-methionine (R)-S-oxide reductase